MARVWIRVVLIKISSRWCLLRVGVESLLRAGVDDWLFAKSCWKRCKKVRGFSTVKSTGLNMESATQSFVTHHAYAFATLRILVEEISFTSNPSPLPFFFRTSALPTEASPSSHRKSQSFSALGSSCWSCCPELRRSLSTTNSVSADRSGLCHKARCRRWPESCSPKVE